MLPRAKRGSEMGTRARTANRPGTTGEGRDKRTRQGRLQLRVRRGKSHWAPLLQPLGREVMAKVRRANGADRITSRGLRRDEACPWPGGSCLLGDQRGGLRDGIQ